MRIVFVSWMMVACVTALPEEPAVTGAGTTGASSDAMAADADADNVYVARHADVGATPEGALSIWLEAAMAAGATEPSVATGGKVALGRLTAPFRSGGEWWRKPSYRTFHQRLSSHGYIFRSYFKGSSADNGYALGSGRQLEIARSEDAGERGWRLDVVSSGADSPRPVYLKKSKRDGLYYVDRFDNLYVDVRKPVDPDAEF